VVAFIVSKVDYNTKQTPVYKPGLQGRKEGRKKGKKEGRKERRILRSEISKINAHALLELYWLQHETRSVYNM
jgi:predicted transposase YdaD